MCYDETMIKGNINKNENQFSHHYKTLDSFLLLIIPDAKRILTSTPTQHKEQVNCLQENGSSNRTMERILT